MSRHRLGTALLATALLSGVLLSAQDVSSPAQAKAPRRIRRDPPGTFMGRRIAPVMSFEGADWLIRETREQQEQPEAMLDALKIAPGSTVADVGAGVGYMSLRIARRVGPEGLVLATDIQPQMIRMLSDTIRAAGVKNVRAIRCTPTETGLPTGRVDLVMMVDVYHECPDPEATLQGLREALKPGGRLALVEFRGEDPDVPILPEHKMTVAQARLEVESQGFRFKGSLEFLPWQHILIFEKPEDAPGPEPKRP
ncbi:MAG: methyltransferase domain-containing protein [Planctomycetaceae bacterium]|nr:methyltransferase domain-containing protein [Planctomycetaceae bacterium]